MREHYEAAAGQGSVQAQLELEEALLPEIAAPVWAWFLELDAARGSNGWGPNAIRHADVDAWQRLYGHQMSAREAMWLLDLDRTYLRLYAENAKKGKSAK